MEENTIIEDPLTVVNEEGDTVIEAPLSREYVYVEEPEVVICGGAIIVIDEPCFIFLEMV